MTRPAAYIAGTGRGIPERVMSNHEFTALGLETSHEWIVERTGIVQRHIAGPDDSTCSMAAAAARGAMAKAGIEADAIDAVILSTATADRLLPSTAVSLQAELGASRAAAFDLSAACSGWLYGMTVAEGLIQSGAIETAVVVGSEKMSSIIDWQDRATCVLFGDGAGAAIVRRNEGAHDRRGILGAYMRTDGSLAELLWRPSGGAAVPYSEAVLADRSSYVRMAGRETFKHAVRSMTDACDRVLERTALRPEDIDILIPHQANVRIIEATAKHARLPMDKVFVNVDRYGNTSSASIPIALDEAIGEGRVREGTTALLVAFGAGFTWGSMVIRF